MNERIDLIPAAAGVDSTGSAYSAPDTTKARAVYARASSIGTGEYYGARTAGIKLDAKMSVHLEEYDGEPYVRWRGKVYSVERTYKARALVELTLRAVEARV